MNAAQEWITYAEATSLTGKSRRTLSRLAKSGDIQATGWGKSRRLLRSDVQRYSPTTACEVVSVSVGTHTLQGLRFGEEEVIATRLIEQTLGYEEGSLSRMVRGPWAGEFEDGVHHRTLDPIEMGAVTRTLTDSETVSGRSPSLHVLTEQGVALVLMKSGKEPAARLRAALAESGFMRSVARAVMDRDEAALARTLSGQQAEGEMNSLILQHLSQQTAALTQLVSGMQQQMDQMQRAFLQRVTQQTAKPPNWHTCDMTAGEVASHLAQTFPAFHDNAKLIHTLTGRSGLRGPGGWEGLKGYSEKRRDGSGYERWFYSPACIDTLHDSARSLGYMPLGAGPGGDQ